MRQRVAAGSVGPGRNRAGNGLLRDESDRWEGPPALSFEFSQQALDLAPGSHMNYAGPTLVHAANILQVAQINQHGISHKNPTPGMQSANAANLFSLMSVKNIQQLFFGSRSVFGGGFDEDISPEVAHSHADAPSETPMV